MEAAALRLKQVPQRHLDAAAGQQRAARAATVNRSRGPPTMGAGGRAVRGEAVFRAVQGVEHCRRALCRPTGEFGDDSKCYTHPRKQNASIV